MLQLLLIALRNLALHRRRTLMLGGAIAGVAALLTFQLCLTSGIRKTMLESATTIASGHLNVGGFYKVTAGQVAPLVTDYQKVAEVVRRTLPDLDYLVSRGRGWARIVSDRSSQQMGIAGVDIESEPGLPRVLKLIAGRLQDLAQPGTILIFESQAKKLEVKVGDTLIISVLTPRGVNNTVDVRIVGIAQDIGILSTFNVFVRNSTLRQLYQLNEGSTGVLEIFLKDMKKIPQDMEKLRRALTAAGWAVMERAGAKPFWIKLQEVTREDWTGQKLDLTTWEEEISFIRWTLTGIEGLGFMLTVVLMVIIVIGIMNSMAIAIRERTREIGTLRAIGMHWPQVMAMFILEAFCLGALSTLAGAGAGTLVAGLLQAAHLAVPESVRFFLMSSTMKFAFEPGRILGGMLVITACTTLISIIPSARAGRLKPIEAMQHIS